ncbi:G4 quadruplex nucleic acid binding protein [Hypocenomyce scalaris]|nr:G4 quadruplex nucleic acid binding protein [Hypocenomyce scalaris]
MSTSASSPDSFLSLLQRSFPFVVPTSAAENDISGLSQSIYPDTTYNDNEKIEISQWLTTSFRLATPDEDEAKHAERLGSLNTHLSSRTTLLGSKPSVADIALFARLGPAVQKWTGEERTGQHGYHHIVRYIDFVQNAPFFGLTLSEEDKVKIDVDDVRYVQKPIDPKEEKERKKKEKAAAAAAADGDATQKPLVVGQGRGQGASKSKKEKAQETVETSKENIKGAVVTGDSTPQPKTEKKKEKPPKAPKQPAAEPPLSPHLIDLRVGHILKAIAHPNADSLYVSTIACGDPPGTDNTSLHDGLPARTVCSGLNGLIPLPEMQNRKVVVVCNLKPVTMRGVKSAAMVLAASPRPTDDAAAAGGDPHAGPVELVSPPAGARAGERVCFEGWRGEPEGVLNPKKKVWEACQVGFTTTGGREVAFDAGRVPQLRGEAEGKGVGRLVTESGGVCTVESLAGAVVR